MAENKTQPNAQNVETFLDGIDDPGKRQDCRKLTEIMGELSGADPVMWGDSIVGFGTYRYQYASGRKGDWFLCGFAPRKRNLTLYVRGYLENFGEILKDLGKFRHGKGCLYIHTLEDIDEQVLRRLISTSIRQIRPSA